MGNATTPKNYEEYAQQDSVVRGIHLRFTCLIKSFGVVAKRKSSKHTLDRSGLKNHTLDRSIVITLYYNVRIDGRG